MSQQLSPYPLIRPAFRGLNKSRQSDTTLGGGWALELQNAVFDDAGRVAARRGWMQQTPQRTKVVGYTDSNTVLLLHCDGANGGTSFPDSSLYAHTMVHAGTGATTSTAQIKFGSAAYNLTKAASDMLTTPASPAEFQVAAADWTVEMFIYMTAIESSDVHLLTISDSTGNHPVLFSVSSAGKLRGTCNKQAGGSVGNVVTGATTITTGVWHHVALVRNGTALSVYLDAARDATITLADGVLHSANDYVGVGGLTLNGVTITQPYWGYIDDLRMSNVARYTGATYIVPSTAAIDPAPVYSVPRQMHEYLRTDGSSDLITAGSHFLFHGITIPVDITGTLTPTADNWQFINFRGYCLGWQADHAPIFYNGTGTFTTLTASQGTVPRGNCALAAFGRVWASEADQQTIKYTALLDPNDWGSSDAGSIDMRTVWTKGVDTIQGIAAFGAALVVFGKRHIIIWTDGQGSVEGIDPTNMYVVDTIEGTGLQARDSIQNIGTGDVVYLSPTGLQSLARVIQTKNNPLAKADLPVNEYLRGLWISEDPKTIRSLYSPTEQFYLLILPKSGTTFCFDTRMPLEDGSLRSAEWPSYGAYSGTSLTNGNIYIGFLADIGKYATYLDSASTYNFKYRSPWMTLADVNPSFEFHEKIPKRAAGIIYTGASQTFKYTISYDFDVSAAGTTSVSVTTNSGRVSEYGTAEYGTNGVYNTTDVTAVPGTDHAEYGTAYNLLIGAEELSGSGRWIQVGVDATINSSFLAVQQLDIYTKIGSVTA